MQYGRWRMVFMPGSGRSQNGRAAVTCFSPAAAVRRPKFRIPVGAFSHWGERQAEGRQHAAATRRSHSVRVHTDSFTKTIYPGKTHFHRKRLGWGLNPDLWAQNVFAECSDHTNEAHETIRAVFFEKKREKNSSKKILVWKTSDCGVLGGATGHFHFHFQVLALCWILHVSTSKNTIFRIETGST